MGFNEFPSRFNMVISGEYSIVPKISISEFNLLFNKVSTVLSILFRITPNFLLFSQANSNDLLANSIASSEGSTIVIIISTPSKTPWSDPPVLWIRRC